MCYNEAVSQAERQALVVDDEESVQEVLRAILEGRGCEAFAATTAAEATLALEEDVFDLVVVDKNLPDRSGLDLLAEIKGRDPDLEVVMVTGYASLETAVQALRLGAGDFITKPFEDVEVVGEKLAGALERARRARERTRLISRLNLRQAALSEELSARRKSLDETAQRFATRERVRRAALADLAHDLRTPLTTIRGYVDLLRENPTPALRDAYFEAMVGQCDRLERLSDDVLVFVRAEDGVFEVDHQPVRLRTVLDAARTSLKPLYEEGGVSLEFVGDEDLEVLGDDLRLGQLVANLLDNALRYSPASGAVTVEVTPEGERRVRLAVRDQGPGIPVADRSRVFQRFQGDTSNPRSQGLGLSICKDVVEAHGGEIGVDDHPEGGAVFVVLLPRA